YEKGLDVCYPLSTITIPKLNSENALQEMIELVVEIAGNLKHLFDSKP
ncbi:21018_t:CDS:2, partial [Racocetra persica]